MTRDQDACGLMQTAHTVPGLDPLPVLLVPQRGQPDDDATTSTASRGAVEELVGAVAPATWSSTSAATTARCSTATAARDLRYLGFDPSDVARYAVEKGYDVVQRLLQRPRAAAQRYPDRARRSSRASRCSTTSRTRAAFVRDVADSLAEDGVWVMELHYLPLDARAERLRRDRPRAPRVLLAGGARAAVRRGGARGRRRRAQRHQRRLDPALHRPRRQARAPPRRRPSGCRSCACASSRWRSTRRRPTRSSRCNVERVGRELRGLLRVASSPTARRSTSTAPRPRATRSSSTRTSTAA